MTLINGLHGSPRNQEWNPKNEWYIGSLIPIYLLANTPNIPNLQTLEERNIFEWTFECDTTFAKLKEVLSRLPILV